MTQLVWVDTETTGLNYYRDVVLELGIVITDEEFKPLALDSWLVKWHGVQSLADEYVYDMHVTNELWNDLRFAKRTATEVANEAVLFLEAYNAVGLPMCGSSVHFDRAMLRAQMEPLEAAFHYRNIDVSTFKETLMIYAPDAVAKRPDAVAKHRVIDDIMDSITEYKYYVNYLIK